MLLPSKLRVVCLCLFSCFLRISSFTRNNVATLVSWPSIPKNEVTIYILNCGNFTSVPADAAAGRPALTEVMLRNNVISHIDDTWIHDSPNIQLIWLYNNKLTSVPAFNCGAAGSEGCSKLMGIWLHHNLIASVPARSFANLPKLQKLYLHDNKIATLASLWIVDCPSVKELSLHTNANLARFIVSEDWESRGLANLAMLDLHDCDISSLDRDFLLLLPKLADLYIYGNPMKTLPKFVESHPVQIHTASMGDFVCDCSATKLARNGMIDSTNKTVFCGSPDYNVGKRFSQLQCRETSETPMSPVTQPRCDDVTGGVTSSAQSASMEFLELVAPGECDVFLPRDSSECSSVSVRVCVSGSPSTRALYQLCRLEALTSTHCRFRCECPHATCPVFVK